MVNKYAPAAVLAGNTPLGRELTARLDARKGLGSVQDATALKIDNGTPVWTVPLYGGTVLNDVVVDTLPVVATVRSGAFSKPEAGEAAPVTAEAVEVPADRVAITVPVSDDLGVPPGTEAGETLAAYETADGTVQLLALDVRVLSVPQTGSGVVPTGALTLAVAPDDVARLLAASDEGSLRLALPGARALDLAEGEQTAPTSVPPEEVAGEGAASPEGAAEGGAS